VLRTHRPEASEINIRVKKGHGTCTRVCATAARGKENRPTSPDLDWCSLRETKFFKRG